MDETDTLIVTIGSQPEFASALDNGLKMATTDMVEWLTKDYGLEPWAAHLLIGYQGRYDVVCPMTSAWDLHRAWPEAELKITPDAGHSIMEPGNTSALVQATDKFR